VAATAVWAGVAAGVTAGAAAAGVAAGAGVTGWAGVGVAAGAAGAVAAGAAAAGATTAAGRVTTGVATGVTGFATCLTACCGRATRCGFAGVTRRTTVFRATTTGAGFTCTGAAGTALWTTAGTFTGRVRWARTTGDANAGAVVLELPPLDSGDSERCSPPGSPTIRGSNATAATTLPTAATIAVSRPILPQFLNLLLRPGNDVVGRPFGTAARNL
jgi:hypothetical protein